MVKITSREIKEVLIVRRRRNTKYFVGLFVVWLCIGAAGFLVGYYVSSDRDSKPPIHIGEEVPFDVDVELGTDNFAEKEQESNNDDQHVASQRVVISEDTRIIFRTRYEKCQSIIDEVMEPLSDMLGLNRTEFNDFIVTNFEGWNQVGFSHEEVIVFQSKDQFCPKHFWVSQEDGYITVYQFDERGNKNIVEKTRIPISTLPKIDQDRLINGIPLPSREAVDNLLEDYSG